MEVMKRKIYISFVLTAALILFGMSSVLALNTAHQEAIKSTNANISTSAMAPWFIETVDSATDVGKHVSAAIDPSSGNTCVSYYDAENKDLRMARYVGSGGNCGPDNGWKCELVDSEGDVGQYNSTASCPSADGIDLNVTYYDATNGALKYAGGTCDQNGCTYTPHTIDSGNPNISVYKGLYTSVKTDSKGIPHIAYYYSTTYSSDALLYAHWVGDGTGNCGKGDVAGQWQCDLIQNAEGVGMYASLDIDGNDKPSIAYYDANHGYPLVAAYIGSGGNCGPSNDWYCRTVQKSGLDTGKYISLNVENNGLANIAYYNDTEGTLEYAKWVGSGGNCGFSSISLKYEWQCEWIDDMGTTITPPMGIAIAEDAAGYPIIAYQDASEDLAPAALKLARPHVALDPNTVPNCGPQDLFYLWSCQFIDIGASTDISEAGSVSMVVNSTGLTTIAYHELDSYAYPSQGNLKVAYQRLQLFLPLALQK
jgi:hypothetical protein